MDLETLITVIAWAAGVIVTTVLGYIVWLWRRLQVKIENSITRAEVEKMLAEKEAAITREIAAVKEDTRSMADSVVKAVKGLEDRFDSLMLHLLNNRNNK